MKTTISVCLFSPGQPGRTGQFGIWTPSWSGQSGGPYGLMGFAIGYQEAWELKDKNYYNQKLLGLKKITWSKNFNF